MTASSSLKLFRRGALGYSLADQLIERLSRMS
jgi:hypothetical protein